MNSPGVPPAEGAPVPFEDFMERALYGPDGFYSTGRGRAGGRRGDFITSPEVGPLFGAVLARWLDEQWHDLGQPDPFRVIDAGAGPGSLLRSIALAEPDCAPALRTEEVDLAPGSGDRARELPRDLAGTVIIANELLDNLPFRIGTIADGTLLSAHVLQSELVWIPTDPSRSPALHAIGGLLPLGAEPGQTFPILDAANRWIAAVQAAGASRLLIFDYGTPLTADLAARNGDWLRTYKGHERGSNPLFEPGHWDITTDIAEDQLPPPSQAMTQDAFLRTLGINQLVDDGREHWKAKAANPDLTAIRMRSRISEAEALLDPAGLGAWRTLLYRA